MNIVVAPDKFKGSIDSISLAENIRREIVVLHPDAQISTFPLADGGDGFEQIIHHYFNTTTVIAQTVDALGRPIQATYQFDPATSTAFIEMASASGIALLKKKEYDPMITSTYGTGLLIRDAIARGATHVVIGVGGSATNDGGTGMADALGFMFLDKNGDPILPSGESLVDMVEIVMPENDFLEDIQFSVACDVTNPFYGEQGAAYVYAPQKGASPEQVKLLDEGLKQLDELFMKFFGKSVSAVPGAGAAGGLGGGCEVFLNAKIISGSQFLIDAIGLEEKIQDANVVITGEGRLDEQSLQGKVVGNMIDIAKKHNKRVRIVCGESTIDEKDWGPLGIESVATLIAFAPDKETSIADPLQFLSAALKKIF